MNKFFHNKLNIFLFFTSIFLIIGSFYTFFTKNEFIEDLWNILTVLDTSTAIALAILAYMAYKEYMKNEDEIELKIAIYKKGNYEKAIKIKDFIEIASSKVKVLRKDINRAEILGLLGMFQKNTEKRYNLSDNKLILLLLKELKEVQIGKKNECIIPILEEDYIKYFKPD